VNAKIGFDFLWELHWHDLWSERWASYLFRRGWVSRGRKEVPTFRAQRRR